MKENTILKPANVVMLDTNIFPAPLHIADGELVTGKLCQSTINYQYKHLYFTSDDEIREADWCINQNKDTLYQIFSVDAEDPTGVTKYWTKVIATTNPELWIHNAADKGNKSNDSVLSHCYNIQPLVPKIDTSFVEAYVREQGRIDKVMLEYDEEEFNNPTGKYDTLHLKPNGSVIVHPFKEKMYSKEELKMCIDSFAKEFVANTNTAYKQHDIQEWFDKNYPQ